VSDHSGDNRLRKGTFDFQAEQSSCRELCKTCVKPGEPDAQELAEKVQVYGAELQGRRHRKGTEVSQDKATSDIRGSQRSKTAVEKLQRSTSLEDFKRE
jgi:hypothetical protein